MNVSVQYPLCVAPPPRHHSTGTPTVGACRSTASLGIAYGSDAAPARRSGSHEAVIAAGPPRHSLVPRKALPKCGGVGGRALDLHPVPRRGELLPCRLHGRAFAGLEAFDRRDVGAGAERGERRPACAHRLALDVNGARAAQARPAAVLGAGEPERVAQDPQQRRVAGDTCGNIDALLVDEQEGHHGLREAPGRPRREEPP
jgi:hypothetical protein